MLASNFVPGPHSPRVHWLLIALGFFRSWQNTLQARADKGSSQKDSRHDERLELVSTSLPLGEQKARKKKCLAFLKDASLSNE
jgi:hypothetical protein